MEVGDGQSNTDLYQVQSDVTPNCSGAGSVRMLPPLRQNIAAGDSVRLTMPRLRCRRADASVAVRGNSWSNELTLTFAEDKR